MTPVPLSSRTAEQIAEAWRFHAPKIDALLAHTRDELRLIDGYPAGGADGPRGSGDTTATEAAALARYHVTSTREQVRDDLAAIVELSNSFFRVLDAGLRSRQAPAEAPRCTGGVPDCTNVPSVHTLASGALHDALCDSCFTVACHVCGKPRDEQRRVDDRQACGACYRRHLRSQGRAA